jgi:hypothetical protein
VAAGRGPARREPEGIVRRAGFGGVGGEGESFVGLEGHGFEQKVDAADGGVVEVASSSARPSQSNKADCPRYAE